MHRLTILLVPGILVFAPQAIGPRDTIEPPRNQAEVKRLLDVSYGAWRDSRLRNVSRASVFDRDAIFDSNPAFRQIVELGPPAVPHILDRVEADHLLGYAVYCITKRRDHCVRVGQTPGEYVWYMEEYPDMRSNTGPPDARMVLLRWWDEGRRQTPERFAKLYTEWKTLESEGKGQEAAEKYRRIKDLGIDALPLIVEQVRAGNVDLMPVISYLTDAECPATAAPEQCIAWWDTNKAKWTLPPPEPPKKPAPSENAVPGTYQTPAEN